MIKNYFITAIRNIRRNRIQSIIQLLSLSVGITVTILIGMYARYEYTYDRYNEKLDRIYRLEWGSRVGMWSAIGHQIKQEIPEVENVVRLLYWGHDNYSINPKLSEEGERLDKKVVTIDGDFYCDSSIFDLFSFQFIQGDPSTALRDPHTCVLTESTARMIFGNKDPVGQTVDWFTVTGVIKDVKHAHIEIDMLMSVVSFEKTNPGVLNNYENPEYKTYILLPVNGDPVWFEKRINELFLEKWRVQNQDYEPESSFSLLPLKDIYFSTGKEAENNYCHHGNLKLLRILMAVALVILLLAIINYVNLTTARGSLRAREVGIRSVVGASKWGLVYQFLSEAILVTCLSFVIALTLVQLLLPEFNKLAMTDLDMKFMNRPLNYIVFGFSVVVLGLFSGIYPALYLTGFKTTQTLSGEQVTGFGSVIFRRLLLTFQFTVSILLVIGLLVIFKQLGFMKNSDPGFNMDHVIFMDISFEWNRDQSKRQAFRQELLTNPNVRSVAYSFGMMGGEPVFLGFGEPLEINGIKKQIARTSVDPYFFDLMGIEIVEGRNLSWDRPGDYMEDHEGKVQKWLVNETFVHEFNLEPAVGFHKWAEGAAFEIIGVVNDFNFKSRHEKIMPMIFRWEEYEPKASIKIAPDNIQSTLRFIEKTYFQFHRHARIWDYEFLDEYYANQYTRDEKTATIIFNFAVVAMLIACLGLFGLSSFMAARRTKEIGIRKSLGASVQSIFLLLSREFLKWVIISVAIACPLGWYIMNRWLQNFAYRTGISWWILALAILIAFVVTFGTVTWQSYKTARTNPVEALRYE